jgi:TolB-like protein
MSLLAELQRRKVFKVGAAYLVIAWLAVQAASIAFPTFEAPLWALRVFILVCLLGFPIAVVMAWVFDATPEGVKIDSNVSGTKRVFAAAALLVVLALGWYFYGQPAFRKGEPAAKVAAPAPAAPSVDPRSIAVLPFLNMSDDKNNEYFSDGISEELLNVLVRVNGFNVASRTSSFAFKGREIGTPEIARQLKVRYLLEGSVRKQGDQLRITAQLIDANNDRHVLSETYDRKFADIFKIQDEIANAIVTAVRNSMGQVTTSKVVEVRADTSNLNAYDSYLKARELFLARSDLKESIRLYEHAVELDPNFARGWEGLSAVYAVAPSWIGDDDKYYPLAKKAADRALALDPKLSMPWAAIGGAEQGKLPIDWALNLSRFDRALAADPKNTTAYLWRGIDWANLGFFDLAIADFDRCLVIDPGYQTCNRWKALAYMYTGDEQRALALFEDGVAVGYVTNHWNSFVPLLQRHGEHIAAQLLLRDRGATPEVGEALLAAITAAPPTHLDSDEIKRRYLGKKDDAFAADFGETSFYLWFGAFDQVATAPNLNTYGLEMWEAARPDFRNTPGFKKMLERLGVADYWRKHGYPPRCHAVGASDFSCDPPAMTAVK